MTKRTRWMLVALFFIIGVSLYGRICFLTESADAVLLSNGKTGYLVLAIGRLGYTFRYISVPYIMARSFVGLTEFPRDRDQSTIVFTITNESLRKYEQHGVAPIAFTAIHDTIYAFGEGQVLKWSGTNFETLAPEEAAKLGGLSAVMNDSKPQGWSESKDFMESPERNAEIPLNINDGQLSLQVVKHNGEGISLNLLRAGSAPEEIWHGRKGFHLISASKYKDLFEHRK